MVLQGEAPEIARMREEAREQERADYRRTLQLQMEADRQKKEKDRRDRIKHELKVEEDAKRGGTNAFYHGADYSMPAHRVRGHPH